MANDECHTPTEFFEKLPFKFTLDAAANAKNTKCKRFLTDAFNQSWKTTGWIWLNCPYSVKAGPVPKWLEYADVAADTCAGVVCLVIADVSTATRQYARDHADEIVELSPRIHFPSPNRKGSGGFQAYQLVIFTREYEGTKYISRWNWEDEGFAYREQYRMIKV